MNFYEYTFINQNVRSDKAISEQIFAFLKHHRLEQNMSQKSQAKEAGISSSNLSLLETGGVLTFATFLQVLRVLDLLYVLDAFTIQETISPLLLAKIEKNKKKRAGRKTKKINKEI